MSLYPSLEDMKVDQLAKAQFSALYGGAQPSVHTSPPSAYPPTADIQPSAPTATISSATSIYPNLQEYMGLDLSPEALASLSSENSALLAAPPQTVSVLPGSQGGRQIVAPLSSQTPGLARAYVSHGIREVILCKDQSGKVGMRMQAINKGIFVVLVQAGSPAALAGLRFGDQILQINDVVVAGFTMKQVHDLIKKADPKRITLAVRDRPFERTITMHKDSVDHIGFLFKNGKIISLIKDSSAARNGLLTDHQLLEVNGQNVVGLKDSDITKIIREGGNVITVTVMPSFIYDHMMKYMASSLKKKMDHSIPDL